METKIVVDRVKMGNIRRMLDRLPLEFDRDEVMMKVFRKASKPMLSAGRTSASSSIPKVAKDFVWSARKNRGGDIMRVGVVRKDGTHGSLAHLFNDGTANRTTSAGHNRGRIQAHKFWDRAVAQSEPAVVAKINQETGKEIDKYIKKYNL
jgi:hypothetical protein